MRRSGGADLLSFTPDFVPNRGMAASGPVLKLANVVKRYQSPGGAGSLTVLDGVCLEVARGESLAIIGPSGSGKSTLLQIMGTLDSPSAGAVTIEGQDLGGLNEERLAAVRNRQLGFVFQAHYLLPQCTVLENVLVPTLADGSGSPGEAEKRARRLLQRVGLDGRLGHRPGQLSGGECQRVAVVRALINQPQLLLADEPTGSLDQASAAGLTELLVSLNREEGVTLVVVTHARELARSMGRVMELRDGKLGPGTES
jgi:lipoprotein-releasing system ATP-binding protein